VFLDTFLKENPALGDMAELAFKDLSFEKEQDRVKVNFLKMFYFYIEDAKLKKIGRYEVKRNSLNEAQGKNLISY
jgi:hypothetical protein